MRCKGTGSIYWDHSAKGGRRRTVKEHHCWRAEITIAGKRHRSRFCDYGAAEMWLSAMSGAAGLARTNHIKEAS